MFLLFSKKKKDEPVLIFSIGSRSVTGSIVKLSEKENPKIVYSTRFSSQFQNNEDSSKIMTMTLGTLEKVCANIQKEGLPSIVPSEFASTKISKIFAVFSAPWYISESKLVVFSQEKPFAFTDTFISRAIEAEERRFENVTAERGGASLRHKLVPVERTATQIRLNGYETSQPFGKKVTEAELSLYLSAAPERLLSDVEKTIFQYFHSSNFEMHTRSLVTGSVIKDIFPEQNNFISMDISGEVTDISIIKDGIMMDSYSFPMGRNFITRRISEAKKCSPEVALSSATLFFQGRLNIATMSEIGAIIDACRKEWTSVLSRAFAELSQKEYLPQKIFLTADEGTWQFFADTVKKTVFEGILFTEDRLNVTYVDHTILSNFCSFADVTFHDPIIIMECIFFNKVSKTAVFNA